MPTVDKDKVNEIIKRVMSQPVPEQGQLVHPVTDHTRKQVTLEDARKANIPMDIKVWTPKHFVDYFAQQYQNTMGGNYRKVYKSDIMIITQIGDFLVSNGLERNTWTRKAIDWGVKNKDYIIAHEGHFTLQEIYRQVNYFYQQEILPKVENDTIERDTEDTVLLEEIQLADEAGKIPEIFSKFGIPVAVTYLVNIRNVNEEKLMQATNLRLKSFVNGSALEKKQLEQILQASVIGSPYPENFCGLDWREQFKNHTRNYTKEPWWRNEDYKGKPLMKYYSLIN